MENKLPSLMVPPRCTVRTCVVFKGDLSMAVQKKDDGLYFSLPAESLQILSYKHWCGFETDTYESIMEHIAGCQYRPPSKLRAFFKLFRWPRIWR